MSQLRLRSTSRAEDAGFLAMRDIATVAEDTELEYRIVGGQMVRLHVALAGVAEPTVRVTLDADLGVAAGSARNPTSLPASNRSATPGQVPRTASSGRPKKT